MMAIPRVRNGGSGDVWLYYKKKHVTPVYQIIPEKNFESNARALLEGRRMFLSGIEYSLYWQ